MKHDAEKTENRTQVIRQPWQCMYRRFYSTSDSTACFQDLRQWGREICICKMGKCFRSCSDFLILQQTPVRAHSHTHGYKDTYAHKLVWHPPDIYFTVTSQNDGKKSLLYIKIIWRQFHTVFVFVFFFGGGGGGMSYTTILLDKCTMFTNP